METCTAEHVRCYMSSFFEKFWCLTGRNTECYCRIIVGVVVHAIFSGCPLVLVVYWYVILYKVTVPAVLYSGKS